MCDCHKIKERHSYLDHMKGLKPLTTEQVRIVEDFRHHQREVVIPRIVAAVKRRETLAAHARFRGPLF